MEQFLESVNLPALLIGCGVLCVVGVVLTVAINFLGTLVGALGGVLQFGVDIITGGPAAWCSCIVLVVVIVICGGGAYLLWSALSTCGTPQAVNLCTLFGL